MPARRNDHCGVAADKADLYPAGARTDGGDEVAYAVYDAVDKATSKPFHRPSREMFVIGSTM